MKRGELVGIYPEGTISRSFEIEEFKSGAARMALAADVPIVPHVVWGAQRIWTKGLTRNLLRPAVPIIIAVGEPIPPTMPASELTATLRKRMHSMLVEVQDLYGHHPVGAPWVPHRLGGGAPTQEQARHMDAFDRRRRENASIPAPRRSRSTFLPRAKPDGQPLATRLRSRVSKMRPLRGELSSPG